MLKRDTATDSNLVVYANQGTAFELSLKVFTSLISKIMLALAVGIYKF